MTAIGVTDACDMASDLTEAQRLLNKIQRGARGRAPIFKLSAAMRELASVVDRSLARLDYIVSGPPKTNRASRTIEPKLTSLREYASRIHGIISDPRGYAERHNVTYSMEDADGNVRRHCAVLAKESVDALRRAMNAAFFATSSQ